MKKTAFLIVVAAACATLLSCQTGTTNHAACAKLPPYKGSPEFERMKTLVGKWSGESPEMGKMHTQFRVIAGKLTMTHYCMLRNQPRMKLVKSTPTSLTFDLAPTPGLDPAKDPHMHGATYTFIDNDHFQLEGVAWENGKSTPCGPPVIFTRQ